MYSNSQFTSNRQVIAQNIRSSYKEVESFESIDKINFQKSLEHEAYSLFNKGELSQKELSQLMIDGQIDNSIQKSKHELIDGIISKNGQFIVKGLQWEPYTERLEFYKSLGEEISDFIQKGRGAQIGEIRTWGGEQYVKHADGWVHIHKKTGKVSVLPTSGTVRKIDGNDDHKAHYSKHISEKTDNGSKNDEDSKKNETPKSEERGKGDYASKLKSDLYAEIENHNKKVKYHKDVARKFDLTYGKPTASSNEHLREAARHEKLAKEKLEAYNKKDSEKEETTSEPKKDNDLGSENEIEHSGKVVKVLSSGLDVHDTIDPSKSKNFKVSDHQEAIKFLENQKRDGGDKLYSDQHLDKLIDHHKNMIESKRIYKDIPLDKLKHNIKYPGIDSKALDRKKEMEAELKLRSVSNGKSDDSKNSTKTKPLSKQAKKAFLNVVEKLSSTNKETSPSTVEKNAEKHEDKAKESKKDDIDDSPKIEPKEKLTPYQISKEIQHYNEAIKSSTQQLKYLGKSKRPADVHNKERHQKIIDILNSRIEKLKNGIHHDENGNLMNSATWLDKADSAANETEKKIR